MMALWVLWLLSEFFLSSLWAIKMELVALIHFFPDKHKLPLTPWALVGAKKDVIKVLTASVHLLRVSRRVTCWPAAAAGGQLLPGAGWAGPPRGSYWPPCWRSWPRCPPWPCWSWSPGCWSSSPRSRARSDSDCCPDPRQERSHPWHGQPRVAWS